MIMARRAKEQQREKADAVVRDTRRVMDIAQFEHRTQAKIEARVAKERVASIQRRMKQDLDRRRARLAEMLSEEDDMYSQLLEETFETPDQRKARLFGKAKALRAAREAKRRALVAKITEDRWRDMSDDLRTLDSQAVAQRCAEGRITQLQEAEDARVRAYEEEQKAARDWEELRQAKIRREEEEAKAKAARDEEMRLALDQQVRVRNSLVAAAKQEEELSAREMLARWEAERKAEQAAAAAAVQREKDEAARVRVQNEEFARVRAIEAAKELAEDQARLQAAMAREAAAAAADRAAAEERRQAAIAHQKHLQAQAAVEQAEATELDRMYLEEQEKMWKKRQDQWDREEAARQRLMAEVDRSRKQQMALKAALAEAERASDEATALRLQRQIAESAEADLATMRAQRNKALEHQEDLRRQMAARQRAEARSKQEDFLEFKLMQRAEEQYKARLARMKREGAPAKDFRRKKTQWYS